MAVTVICTTFLPVKSEGTELQLVPYPRQVELQHGVIAPGKNLVLTHDGHAEIAQLADTLVRDLAAIGFSASHGEQPSVKDAGIISLRIGHDRDPGAEGYRLKIDSAVSLSAASIDGLFWGTRTLLQLLGSGPGKSVPQLTITDKPAFEYRGLMVDNARNFHSIDFHIETIKRMASFKMNRYQVHFSDHESYTLPSAAFPNLPTPGRHYTAAEIKRLVDVARRYHVAIVPEIDVPGHSAALLRGIGGLGCDGKGGKLCIGREKTYETLDTLFSEVMEMMPGAYWHLGADEVGYDGTACRGCAARMKEENLNSGGQLFHYFINRMHGLVKGKGRRMLVWEGFSPTLDPKLHKDIIVCPFDVKHRGKMPDDYLQAGYRLLNTSWSPLYVADKIYMTTPEVIALWSPFMFGAGRSPQPFRYWKKLDPQVHHDKVLGAQMCSWAIEEMAEEGLLFGTGPGFHDYGRPGPRVQIMAERVWTGPATTAKDLLERVGAGYW